MGKRSKESIWGKVWRYLAAVVGHDTTREAFYKSRHRKPKDKSDGDND